MRLAYIDILPYATKSSLVIAHEVEQRKNASKHEGSSSQQIELSRPLPTDHTSRVIDAHEPCLGFTMTTMNASSATVNVDVPRKIITVKHLENSKSNQLSENCSSKCRKQVSFAPSARARLTIHITDYSNEEHKACWYSTSEMERIREDMKQLVDLLSAGFKSEIPGSDPIERNINLLGVECRTRAGRRFACNTRRLAWDAVLGEQSDQRKFGQREINDEMVAVRYAAIARECVLMAIRRAVFPAVKASSAPSSKDAVCKSRRQPPAPKLNSSRCPMTSIR